MEFQSEKNVITLVGLVVKTVLTAVTVTAALMALLALLICYTPLPEETVTPLVYVLNYLSVFLAGLFSAAKSGKKGFVTGLLAGAGYMLTVYLIGYILFGGIEFSQSVIRAIIYCALCGMVGGIVGINLSHRK